jgi:hypothetical protein
MHFFDYVLPIQFPFYQPAAADGGRGWFLALLLQSPPLYNAALSLAAHHQNSLRPKGLPTTIDDEEHEQQLYVLAIGNLRQHIEVLRRKTAEDSLKDSIQVLACIFQLIMLEVGLVLSLFYTTPVVQIIISQY